MTKRAKSRQKVPSVFNWGTLVNVLTIPLFTGALTLLGFYFSVRDIPAKLDKETAARQASLEKEGEARERLRSAVSDYAAKTTAAISTLSADQKVTQEHLKSVDSTLDRAVGALQNIELAVGRPKK